MAEDKTENLVSKPPLQVKITDQNGLISRAWSIWIRDIYRRVSYKGGNSIDESIEDIAANSEGIIENALAIAENSDNIEANAQEIVLLANGIDAHINASKAHGSNGNIVGFNDIADELFVGLVKRMASIADAVDTTVNISTADIGTAPATYDQAYTQSVTNLTNENKAAINQLASDLNNAIAVLNNLLAESKTSGQMTT